ncbi:MAG: hypothetical protein R2802_02860 [Flavobacteriaceae bacterium]|nr:hypothetical protein [Mangrovimonas sp.]
MRKVVLVICLMVVSCKIDTQDVVLSGYIYDSESEKPIPNATLKIENWYYGNSPDESYTGYGLYDLTTDERGFYSVNLDTSAMINIWVIKEGYQKEFKSEKRPIKNEKINVYLKRVN